MKLSKAIFGALALAIIVAGCADPTSPRPPEEGGEEQPPTTALLGPAQSTSHSGMIGYG